MKQFKKTVRYGKVLPKVQTLERVRESNNSANLSELDFVVLPGKSNKEYGWMNLTQQKKTFNGTSYVVSTRTCLVRGPVDCLKEDVAERGAEWPGRIWQYQCLETAIPQEIIDMYFNKDKSIAQNIAENPKWIKRNGDEKDGAVVLTKNGARILRFNIYDETGEIPDQIEEHDNKQEAEASSLKMRMTRNALKAKQIALGATPAAKLEGVLAGDLVDDADLNSAEETDSDDN